MLHNISGWWFLATPLKNMMLSIGMKTDIPNINGKIKFKCSKPPTRFYNTHKAGACWILSWIPEKRCSKSDRPAREHRRLKFCSKVSSRRSMPGKSSLNPVASEDFFSDFFPKIDALIAFCFFLFFFEVATWWLIPRIVSGLVHPSYKWTNPTYPIYNQGYNPLTKWDEPPSTNHF